MPAQVWWCCSLVVSTCVYQGPVPPGCISKGTEWTRATLAAPIAGWNTSYGHLSHAALTPCLEEPRERASRSSAGSGLPKPLQLKDALLLGITLAVPGDVVSVGKDESSVSQKMSSPDNFSVPFALCFVSGLAKLGKLQPAMKYEPIQHKCMYLFCGMGRLGSVNPGHWHFIISSCSSR